MFYTACWTKSLRDRFKQIHLQVCFEFPFFKIFLSPLFLIFSVTIFYCLHLLLIILSFCYSMHRILKQAKVRREKKLFATDSNRDVVQPEIIASNLRADHIPIYRGQLLLFLFWVLFIMHPCILLIVILNRSCNIIFIVNLYVCEILFIVPDKEDIP